MDKAEHMDNMEGKDVSLKVTQELKLLFVLFFYPQSFYQHDLLIGD